MLKCLTDRRHDTNLFITCSEQILFVAFYFGLNLFITTTVGIGVFVVADGRTSASEGLSLYQLAEFMQTLGVKTAYNLDGGGSSTMVFCGSVVNKPTTNGKTIAERSVSDIVYIG